MKLVGKVAYSFGAVAMALSYQAFSTFIIFFYVDVVKLPPYLAAIGMIIYGIWNAINDPIAGYISDHTHSRWGRRIPYIALGAIPFGLVYYMLWNPPFTGVSQTIWLFVYFVGFICLFDGFYSVTVLNWQCLYPEMFPSLKERSQVNAIRQTFSMIGLVLGVAIPPLIYGEYGWSALGMTFGIIIAFSLLVTLFGSHEHNEFCCEVQMPFFQSFKATLHNKAFLTFVTANLFVQFAFTIVLASVPFFAKYILDISALKTTAVLASAFLTAIPMLFVWEWLTIKFGPKHCFMAAMVCLGLALTPLFFVVSFELTLLTAALIGMSLAGFILIVDIIISEVIDEDEVKTGTRREGIYFGGNAFVCRLAIALEAFLIGMVFQASGYNPYVFSQTSEFLLGLRWLIAGFPIIALGLAFVLIWFYPISDSDEQKLEQEVAKIHAKKGVT